MSKPILPVLLLAALAACGGHSGEAPPTRDRPSSTPDTLRILAYNTHHGEGMDGALDLERIADLIVAVGPDVVGDFNSLPGSPVMELLSGRWKVPAKTGPPFTFPADAPAREIDFVLVRAPSGFRVLEYRVLDETVASDHRPVLMVMELS